MQKFPSLFFERSWELVSEHAGTSNIYRRLISRPGAALNIPSAMALIIRMFPDPEAQSRALAGFAGAAAIGNGLFFACLQVEGSSKFSLVLGLIVGAAHVSFAPWTWV